MDEYIILQEKYYDLMRDFETLKDVKNREIAELKSTTKGLIAGMMEQAEQIAELKEQLLCKGDSTGAKEWKAKHDAEVIHIMQKELCMIKNETITNYISNLESGK